MESYGLLYRLIQKWKYHSSKTSLEKKIAEINKFNLQIVLHGDFFEILGCDLRFIVKRHSFIVDRFALFLRLLRNPAIRFGFIGEDLVLKFDQISLRITTAEELFIFNEVFIQGCYNVVVKDEFKVIDVGMNVGIASLFFASNPKVAFVLGFEPFTPTFHDAQLNFNLNPHFSAKITSYNYGLSNSTKTLTLPYSSHLKGKNSINGMVIGLDQTIELRKADEVFKWLIDKDPDSMYLVKMDCEGAEYEIFERYRNINIPAEIFGFVIEWHRHSPGSIIDILVSNDFKVHKIGAGEIGFITAFR